MVHRTSQQASAPIGQASAECAAPVFDFYTRYCEMFGATYGGDKCPTRDQWDAMCAQPRNTRKLSDDEFDSNQYSMENGDGPIF